MLSVQIKNNDDVYEEVAKIDKSKATKFGIWNLLNKICAQRGVYCINYQIVEINS